MMGSPWASLLICLGYVYLVEVALPRYMLHRPAWQFRNLLIFYNFAMVALSGYIFIEVLARVSCFCFSSFRVLVAECKKNARLRASRNSDLR